MAQALLEIEDVVAAYGPVVALHGVTFQAREGQIVTLLGANGAGKSTTLRTISGLVKPMRGQIRFAGQALHRMAAEQIVRAGVVHVPEGRQIFADLTVEENLDMGAYTRRDRAAVTRDKKRVLEYFPRLGERRSQQGGTLSGGEQQMLAIGRGLMAKPRLLLLDEPSLGLAPLIVREIFDIVQSISRDEGLTVVLVEQDVGIALRVADYGYVLMTGTITLEGPSERLLADDSVRKSYLGI